MSFFKVTVIYQRNTGKSIFVNVHTFYEYSRYINYKMTERSLQDRNFGTLKPTRKAEEAMGETCPIVSHENGAERKTDIDDFYYSPSASEIPNIDVPESLPDLPGKAMCLYTSTYF